MDQINSLNKVSQAAVVIKQEQVPSENKKDQINSLNKNKQKLDKRT